MSLCLCLAGGAAVFCSQPGFVDALEAVAAGYSGWLSGSMDNTACALRAQRLERTAFTAHIGRGCDLFCNQFEPAPAQHAGVQRLALGHTLCMAFAECRHAGADHLVDEAVALDAGCKKLNYCLNSSCLRPYSLVLRRFCEYKTGLKPDFVLFALAFVLLVDGSHHQPGNAP